MSMSKIAFFACGLIVAIAAVAPAREYGELEIRERALMYINPTTGKVMMMGFGTKGHDMIMKNGGRWRARCCSTEVAATSTRSKTRTARS